MPGTILVSVLEFKGLQSTPPQVSIKVSMGKKEYQTWDKEDFSFPLTTLRDNLIIALHDSEGNEISHTGVETRLVVEKGLWDDIFHLEGGGHVHLKLQFVLSEEERNRIRVMRESVLIKKHGELPSSNLRSPGRATIVGSKPQSSLCLNYEVSDPQKSLLQSEAVATNAGLVSTLVDVIENARYGTKEGEEIFSMQKQKIPIDARRIHQPSVSQGFEVHLPNVNHVEKTEIQTPQDNFHVRAIRSEEASPSSESSEFAVGLQSKSSSPKLKEDGMYAPEKQNPVGKTPSKVRNMITAFEGNLTQDTGSMKPPAAKFQSNKTGDFKNKLKQKEVDSRKEEISSEERMRASAGQAATVSGRMLPENISRQQPGRLFGNRRHSGGELSVKESQKGIDSEPLQEADNQRVLVDKMKFKENWKDKHYSFECPGTWIFPVESRYLCMTTSSKEIMGLMGHCHAETVTHLGEKGSPPVDVGKCSMHSVDVKVNESEKTNKNAKKSKLLNSADVEPTRGPVGQAIRAAIMIGFATLVIFTRQRKNR